MPKFIGNPEAYAQEVRGQHLASQEGRWAEEIAKGLGERAWPDWDVEAASVRLGLPLHLVGWHPPKPFSFDRYLADPRKTAAWKRLMEVVEAGDGGPRGIVFPRSSHLWVLHTWYDSATAPGHIRIVRGGAEAGTGVILENLKCLFWPIQKAGWFPPAASAPAE